LQIIALPVEGSFAVIGQSLIPHLQWLSYLTLLQRFLQVVSTRFNFVAIFLNSAVLTICTRFWNYSKSHRTVLLILSCVGCYSDL